MTPRSTPADIRGRPAAEQVGAGTLERLAEAPRLNRWMYERLAPWLGDSVLEVGSGIGNISHFLVDRPDVVLTDTEPAYREYLQQRFGKQDGVRTATLALPTIPDELRAGRFDSVVCVNILEHVEDDHAALVAMRDVLRPGGHLLLLVPARPGLYGTLDRALGHCRRYTPAGLREAFRRAGLSMPHLEYFNLAGMPGWWFVGKVLRRRMIPRSSLRVYDALVPLFRLERLLPWRIGQSLIAIGERAA